MREILLGTCDPIGARDEPNAQDEYDSYVPHVAQLVKTNSSAQKIIDYLLSVERDRMGLAGNPERAVATERALAALGNRSSQANPVKADLDQTHCGWEA